MGDWDMYLEIKIWYQEFRLGIEIENWYLDIYVWMRIGYTDDWD